MPISLVDVYALMFCAFLKATIALPKYEKSAQKKRRTAKQAEPRVAQRTSVKVTRDGLREPRLPHERDESIDSQDDGRATGMRHPVKAARSSDLAGKGLLAWNDLQTGRVDTDRGPVLERVNRRLQSLPDPIGPPAPTPAPAVAPSKKPSHTRPSRTNR